MDSRRIKDWPADERPRERLLRHGPHTLADAEVLAVILGNGTFGFSAVELGRALLRDGWLALARKSPQELLAVKGLGPAKAARVAASLEASVRIGREAGGKVIHTPADVAGLLMTEMARLEQEEFRVVLLDSKHRVSAVETVFRGGLDTVEVFPREVFRQAVGRSAAAVIVAHNHPSGDPEPSGPDIALTRRLDLAGRVLGIPLLDHVVLGNGRFASLREGGHLKD